jgi:tRNA(fMet)-specific endonuclease VapC
VNYLLDTNAVIALLKNRPSGVRSRLRRALSRGAVIAVSSVVLYELWYGVARSERRRENGERLRIFLSGNITIVLFDEKYVADPAKGVPADAILGRIKARRAARKAQ